MTIFSSTRSGLSRKNRLKAVRCCEQASSANLQSIRLIVYSFLLFWIASKSPIVPVIMLSPMGAPYSMGSFDPSMMLPPGARCDDRFQVIKPHGFAHVAPMAPLGEDLIVVQVSIRQIPDQPFQAMDGDVLGVVFEKAGYLTARKCRAHRMGGCHIQNRQGMFIPGGHIPEAPRIAAMPLSMT